ncbi:MAG: hypothetical protein EOO65_02510 [Methanosarcinales archaeon]|nr:MAG: hypothetical protein EOO65_02510 [Methanosarcinales archaeon]
MQSSSCDETRNDGASTAHRRTSSWLLHAHGAPATPQPETGLRDSTILAIVDSTLQAHGIPAIGPSLLAARNSAQLPCSPMRSPPLSTDNRWVAPLSSPTAATRTEATDAPHAHHSVHTSSAPASEAHSAHAASPPGHRDVLGMAEQSRRGGAPSSAPLAQMAVSNVEARQGSPLASGSTGSSPTAAWPAEHTSAHTIHARQRLSFDGSVEGVHTPASPMTASLAEGYRSFMPQAGTMAAWGLRTSMSMYSRSRAAMPHTGSTASTSTELPVDVNNTARIMPLAGLPTPEGGESGGMVHNSAANAKQYVHASRVLEMPACAVDAYSCAPL